jgi:hypothetical protein
MSLQQKFSLKMGINLPDVGFSLDELVIEAKRVFETEGIVGFLRVILILLDQIIYHAALGNGSGLSCCDKPNYHVNKREDKSVRTSVGLLQMTWTRLKCATCRSSFIPLKHFLGLERYQRKTTELEKIVADVVADQSYRRTSKHLETVGEIPVPHTTLHRWIMKSDCDKITPKNRVASIVADGTGYKIKPDLNDDSNRGEMKIVIGVTKDKKLVPYGAWADTSWWDIGTEIKSANHPSPDKIKFRPIADMLVSDGEEELIDGLKRLTKEQQRCIWHVPHGLGPILRKEDLSRDEISKIKSELCGIIQIDLPKTDFTEVRLEDRLQIEIKIHNAEKALQDLINTFIERGYRQAAKYLMNAKDKMFSYVRSWLKTGIIHPRVTSQIERMMREIGRRIKKIGHGWSPKGAAKVTRIIIKKITAPEEWENYWREKMNFTGLVKISFLGCDLI